MLRIALLVVCLGGCIELWGVNYDLVVDIYMLLRLLVNMNVSMVLILVYSTARSNVYILALRMFR